MSAYGFTMTASATSHPACDSRPAFHGKHRADDDENEQQINLSEDEFPRVVLAESHDQHGEQHAHGPAPLRVFTLKPENRDSAVLQINFE